MIGEESRCHTWRWWHCLIVVLAILLAAVRAMLLAPWCDEVAYVDPGAQLALTGRMVSTAWVTNSPEAIWGSSNPGMPLVFAAWFKLIGFGQTQARLLFCLLHFSGVFFLFRWIRGRFNPPPLSLVLGIVASVLLPSLGNAVFQPRLECLAFLLCAWFLHYAFSETPGVLRVWVAPLMLGLAIVFFGLHFAGFFAIAAIAVFAASPSRRTFFQGAGLALGLVAGLALLRYAYARMGVWDVFVAARACHYGRVLDWVPQGWKRFFVIRDIYMVGVLSCIGLLSVARSSSWAPRREWGVWLWSISAIFVVPFFVGLVGIYYANYSWMVVLPVMIFFYIGEPKLEGVWRKAFGITLLVSTLNIAFKFTKHLPVSAKEAAIREQVVAELAAIFPKGNSVAADFPFYYQLVGAGYRVFPRVSSAQGAMLGFDQEYYLPSSVRDKINCVVSKKESAPPVLSGLGGEWGLMAEIPAVPVLPTEETYQIYVRK